MLKIWWIWKIEIWSESPTHLGLSFEVVNCLVMFPTHINPNNSLLIIVRISLLFTCTAALIKIKVHLFTFFAVEVRNPQIQNKQSNEAEQRWRPWTPRYKLLFIELLSVKEWLYPAWYLYRKSGVKGRKKLNVVNLILFTVFWTDTSMSHSYKKPSLSTSCTYDRHFQENYILSIIFPEKSVFWNKRSAWKNNDINFRFLPMQSIPVTCEWDTFICQLIQWMRHERVWQYLTHTHQRK